MSEQEEYRLIEMLKDYSFTDKECLQRLFDIISKIAEQHAETAQGVVSQKLIDELVKTWNEDGA